MKLEGKVLDFGLWTRTLIRMLNVVFEFAFFRAIIDGFALARELNGDEHLAVVTGLRIRLVFEEEIPGAVV